MRSLSIILLILLYSLTAYGQHKNYEVYDYKNPIQIKLRGTDVWRAAQKGEILTFMDSVQISNGGEIHILYIPRNEVYHAKKQKVYSVLEIRNNAQKQSDKTFSAVCAQLKKTHPYDEKKMSIVGATTRGLKSNMTTEQEDSLHKAIVYDIVSIGKDLCNNTLRYDAGVELITHEQDGAIYFSVVNHTNTNYCINVLYYNTDKKTVSLCYVLDSSATDHPFIVLPAGAELDLSMWQFATPTSADKYILFATEYTYNTSEVQNHLQYINWDQAPQTAYDKYILVEAK
jgi:hypothetical protein